MWASSALRWGFRDYHGDRVVRARPTESAVTKRILQQNSLAQHWARDWRALALTQVKRKKAGLDNPREGWEDGTPPPHRDFKERGVMPVCCVREFPV